MNSNKNIKLIIGLNSLLIPLDSKIDNSRNNIDIIGASWELPGSKNQSEPKSPKIIGIKKNFINLLVEIFDKE